MNDNNYPRGRTAQGLARIYPINSRGEERVWRSSYDTGMKRATSGQLELSGGRTVYQKIDHQGKRETLFSNWTDSKFNAGTNGTSLLKEMGLAGEFDYPKSIFTVETALWAQSFGKSSFLALDYFAGSGTTAHAVLEMNRCFDGRRRYFLMEMGSHIDAVIVKRLKKASYSRNWSAGRPVDKEGVSHCFKLVRLESFEDSLNNLVLHAATHITSQSAPEQRPLMRDYFLRYWLDFETANSPSLLNVREFADPTAYKLKIKQPGSDVQVEKAVDLVETFNWLIGLHVALLDKPRTYAINLQREPDPDLPEDQHTRWQATSITETEDGEFWFRQVDGHVLTVPGDDASRERVLVVWRKLTGDAGRDQAALEAWLAMAQIHLRDTEYATIYINGSHALPSDGSSGARLRMTEETFAQRMWEDT